MHGTTRDVEQVLVVSCEQGNQQRGSAVVQINGPNYLSPVTERPDGSDQFQQVRLIIGNSPRQHTVSLIINDDTVVMGFTGIDPGPQLRQHGLPSSADVKPNR
jgi:hypothetical protein